MSERRRVPRALKRLIALGVVASVLTTAILVLGYSRAQPERLGDILDELSPRAVALGVLLHVGSLSLWAVRMWLVARPFTDGFRLRHAHEAVWSSVFTAGLTPGRVGGEPVRFAFFARGGVPAREAGLLTFIERALDIVFFLVGGVVAVVVLVPRLGLTDLKWVLLGVMVFGVLLVIAPVIVLNRPRLLHGPMRLASRFVGSERVDRAQHWVVHEAQHLRKAGLVVMSRSRWVLPVAMLLTACSWGLEFMVLKVMLDAAGSSIAYDQVVLGGILIMILSAVPLLPGGSGLAELGAFAVFAPLSPGLSPAFVVGWRVATYYADIVIGGPIGIRFAGREISKALRRPKKQAAKSGSAGPEEQPPDRP